MNQNAGSAVGGVLATAMFLLFAITSIPSACFCAFIAGNSFATMIPGVKRISSMMIGVTVSIVLAITGVAQNLIELFTIVGASFGPICGAMAADYLLSRGKWSGPRAGFNLAGWISWIAGFAVGAVGFIPDMKGMVPCPPVAAFVVGFVLYLVLAALGLQSKKLAMPNAVA